MRKAVGRRRLPGDNRCVQFALTNLERLLADGELHGVSVLDLDLRDGERCRFELWLESEHADVWMPDLELERVRFLHGDPYPDGDPGSFLPPRVVVNGSAWTWPYAIEMIAVALAVIGYEDVSRKLGGSDARRRREQAWRDLAAAFDQ